MAGGFDTRGTTDNRAYDYAAYPTTGRAEHDAIVEWVPRGSRVVDLGCGNGTLLARLRLERDVTGTGVEISESGVAQSVTKGLDVRRGAIDAPLPFADDAFDIAICNVTIQMVLYPEVLLREMHRIAPISIVSFANFAFIRNRIDYLLTGRMPRPMLFGYRWYDTGHIHQLSLLDFVDLSAEVGFRIEDARYRRHRQPPIDWLYRRFPNVFTSIPLLRLHRI